MGSNLWVTPYRSNERFAAGDYPNRPIIQLTRIGFHHRPHGFLDDNPAIDVPPPPAHRRNHPREKDVPAARHDA